MQFHIGGACWGGIGLLFVDMLPILIVSSLSLNNKIVEVGGQVRVRP